VSLGFKTCQFYICFHSQPWSSSATGYKTQPLPALRAWKRMFLHVCKSKHKYSYFGASKLLWSPSHVHHVRCVVNVCHCMHSGSKGYLNRRSWRIVPENHSSHRDSRTGTYISQQPCTVAAKTGNIRRSEYEFRKERMYQRTLVAHRVDCAYWVKNNSFPGHSSSGCILATVSVSNTRHRYFSFCWLRWCKQEASMFRDKIPLNKACRIQKQQFQKHSVAHPAFDTWTG
jgi:hypothetical protein